jgi:biotin transport system substrate-specific component
MPNLAKLKPILLKEVFMAMSYSYPINEVAEDRSWLKEATVILGASIIIALFAPISFRLPFTPVPVGTQAHVILLLSCLLGSKRAVMAVMTFLFQGAVGLPVFAGGTGGILILAGTTGGYLVGYLVAAFVTGFLMERTIHRTPSKAFLAMGLGNLTVYLFGLPWLSRFVGWESAFLLGMAPFLIADWLKLVVATRFLKDLRYTK